MSTPDAKFRHWFDIGLKLYTDLYFVPEDHRKQMAGVFAQQAISKKPANAQELAKEVFNYELAGIALDEIDFSLRGSKILIIDDKTPFFFKGRALSSYVAIKRALYSLYRDSFGALPFAEKLNFQEQFYDFVFLWVNVEKTFQEGIGLGPRIENAIADHGESKVKDLYCFFQYFIKMSPKVEVGKIGGDNRLPHTEISSILEDYAHFFGKAENTSAAKGPSLSEENDSNNFTRCDYGETWMITFQGKSVSFKDAKGLRYLAILLDSPGKSFTPKMLITLDSEAPDFSAESTQDAAHQAGIADKDVDQGIPRFEPKELQRLKLDREKLESTYRAALERKDIAKAEKVDQEKQALEQYILQGTNIRGQPRQIASEAEKQRISVYNAIKYQLRKFKKAIPTLHAHINNNLKTGSVLVYQPSPKVSWTVSF